MWNLLTSLKAEEIVAIVGGVSAGIVAIIAAIGKIINEQRRNNGHDRCCITGRKLKPKKTTQSKSSKNS